MNHGVHLLAYADRFGGSITGLTKLLSDRFRELSGVHILPFFVPFDGDDAGFDPVDHAAVDPRLGSWEDVRTLADAGHVVTADLIVNHMSADSVEFQDWLAHGPDSEYDGLFLTFDKVFPEGASADDITAFYRPRPGLPFTPYQRADGTRLLVWTTFMPSQVDIDVRHPAGEAYLRRVLAAFADGGVSIVRIDAVGYAIKTPGTDSFMTPETLDYVSTLTGLCHEYGLEVLVEVHAHHSQQQAIAPLVDYVYDFATPALLLHSLVSGRVDRLAGWIAERPENAVTVLDTHDGIGIIDAGPVGALPGIIDEDEMAQIFAAASAATDGESDRASVVPAWCTLPHQINATFFHTLDRDPTAYLLARAVQLFLPGQPQVYYVGLLAGENDVAEYAATGQGRDINRHRYTELEIDIALGTEVVQALLALVRLRSDHPAFGGKFAWEQNGPAGLRLAWSAGVDGLVLDVDFAAPAFSVEIREPGGTRVIEGVSGLAGSRAGTRW